MLAVTFLCEFKNWLGIKTFAAYFKSHAEECKFIDKFLFEKVVLPRFLEIATPSSLSVSEAMELLQELKKADQNLKNQIKREKR
jgi:hypothetical protein